MARQHVIWRVSTLLSRNLNLHDWLCQLRLCFELPLQPSQFTSRLTAMLLKWLLVSSSTRFLRPIESEGFCPQLLIGAQLPRFSGAEMCRIRTAIQTAGGMVETVRVNYQIRRPQSSSDQRPKSCDRCRYYYGKRHGNAQLICAMHPYGPSDDPCQDWEAPGN